MNIAPENCDKISGKCEVPVIIQNNIEGMEREMEKISKEELMEKLNLSEADLKKVAGGEGGDECLSKCEDDYKRCMRCIPIESEPLDVTCRRWKNICIERC